MHRIVSIDEGRERLAVPETREFENFTDRDGQFLAATQDFARTLLVDDLVDVAMFAASERAGNYRLLFARALIDRERLDLAARVLVADAVRRDSVTSYGTWKWWDYSFSMRPDFKELSRQFGNALFEEFANGGAESRRAIARIFGVEPRAAEISPSDFRALVESRPASRK